MALYKFLIPLYLRQFAIIFFGINLFHVSIDVIFNKNLPQFTNLKVLFVFYSFIESMNLTLELVLVFAFIWTMVKLINSNNFVCLLSLGYDKKKILKPFLGLSALIVLASIFINLTDLAYVTQKKRNILKYQSLYTNKENIFLKYHNSYIYFGELLPIKQLAQDVKIYEFDNELHLNKIYYTKEAHFKDGFWILKQANVIEYPKVKNFDDSKLTYSMMSDVKTLEDFQPKIINSIYEESVHFSIIDAFNLIKLLTSQYINTNKARAVLYKSILFPLFAIFMIVIIFAYTPMTKRLSNMSLYSLLGVTASLCMFGLFKVFEHLSFNAKGLNTELLSLVPFSALLAMALFHYQKKIT